jgi:MFS family permease
MFASQSLYMNVSAYLPLFVYEHFPTMTSLDVGAILSGYPISFLIATGIMSDAMISIGRKNVIFAGILIVSAATFMFGSAGFCTN